MAAHQRPRRRVHGIKVDSIDAGHRRMKSVKESPEPSPVSPGPVSPMQPPLPVGRNDAPDGLRLISPMPPLSPLASQLPETVFDEQQETRFHPDEASRSLEKNETIKVSYPKRFS